MAVYLMDHSKAVMKEPLWSHRCMLQYYTGKEYEGRLLLLSCSELLLFKLKHKNLFTVTSLLKSSPKSWLWSGFLAWVLQPISVLFPLFNAECLICILCEVEQRGILLLLWAGSGKLEMHRSDGNIGCLPREWHNGVDPSGRSLQRPISSTCAMLCVSS